jgi:DNA-binding PadR family transcriptional regulator
MDHREFYLARRKSEFECFTLGLIWKHGPLTAYSIRLQFRQSPSSYWSGSAGALYPMLARLESHGLVSTATSTGTRREVKQYTITREGIESLRQWLQPPFPPEALSVNHDVLGARARFMDLLDDRQRRRWFDAAVRALDDAEHSVERWAQQNADPTSRVVAAHGRMDIRMRRAWLEFAREQLLHPSGGQRASAGSELDQINPVVLDQGVREGWLSASAASRSGRTKPEHDQADRGEELKASDRERIGEFPARRDDHPPA